MNKNLVSVIYAVKLFFRKFTPKTGYFGSKRIFLATAAVVLLFTIVITFLRPVLAASLAIDGRAVSLNTGGYLDFRSNYNANVRVNWKTGFFEGYAWSEDVGWVAFGGSGSDNPNGAVFVNIATGSVTGKARVLLTGGDIVFDSPGNVVINPATGVMSGYAWSEDIGWLQFDNPGVNIVNFSTDLVEPVSNASEITMLSSSTNGYPVTDGWWSNGATPSFSWTAGADDEGGSGLRGHCIYLGTEADGDPGNSETQTGSAGILTNSPISVTGTDCLFLTTETSLDLALGDFLLTPLVNGEKYYLKIKAIDNAGNTHNSSTATFSFWYDDIKPTNVSYISCASGSFSNVEDMSFSWPVSGAVAAADANSKILGWQYQINTTSGAWLGNSTGFSDTNYIATSSSSLNLPAGAAKSESNPNGIDVGNNVIYFRSIDNAGNTSTDATIRTCNLSYGGAAPHFEGTDKVTVTPETGAENSFALAWPGAQSSNTISNYYYMTTPPPSNLATMRANTSTYIDNGDSTIVSATSLPGVNKGGNRVYVVAVDSEDNYSPSNYIYGDFTLESSDPDNIGNLVASDSSIKSQSQWNVTLTWTAPSYQGAGNLTYIIHRSSNGVNFSQVGTTSGLSYVDNAPSSQIYYYKVYTRDGANAMSSGTNAVSITPTGKWTTAPSLDSGPSADNIATKKATITWSTSRTSDTKVQFGTSSGSYGEVEPSNSSQVTAHSIQLTGLNPGTTYYYRAKWTDEDGNTGTSEEKSFTTADAPTAKDVEVTNIGLSGGLIKYTVTGASKVKIYYGTTTSFGGAAEVSTSTSETTYTTQLTGLLDGTKYYYKINTFDSDNSEYEGTVLDFTTLPRPKISSVRIQQVANTAQSTVLVSWITNTEVSSIVTYYPQTNPSATRDEVNIALTKGEHKMIIRGLLPQTDYVLVVRGRDKIGNEAKSEAQRFTTATDTRPPQITDLQVEGAAVPPTTTTAQESMAQLIISWNTDEPSTSQVEFGEGTGSNYSQKTQEDSNLTYNHLVIISGLTPSKVYHLRSISRDSAGNTGFSIDTVTITPKATENALNLVISSLQEVFGFLGGFRR